jgi:hypothetical protein
MSIKQIIKESMEKNPLGLKEALEEELRARVALALEAKMSESDDDEEDENEDDEDEDLDESAELAEISKGKLDAYMDKSHDEFKKIQQKGGRAAMTSKQARRYDDHPYKDNPGNTAFNKLTGRARVNAKESFDLSDLTLEDFMMSEDFEQLDEISKKTLASYVKKASSQASKDFNTYGTQKRKSSRLASKAMASGTGTANRADYDKEADDAMDKANAAMKRYDKRATGIDRAKDRLAK